jgi:hypothetical protein
MPQNLRLLGGVFGLLALCAVDIQNRAYPVAVEQIGRAPMTFLDKPVAYALPVFEFARSRHSQGELVDKFLLPEVSTSRSVAKFQIKGRRHSRAAAPGFKNPMVLEKFDPPQPPVPEHLTEFEVV